MARKKLTGLKMISSDTAVPLARGQPDSAAGINRLQPIFSGSRRGGSRGVLKSVRKI